MAWALQLEVHQTLLIAPMNEVCRLPLGAFAQGADFATELDFGLAEQSFAIAALHRREHDSLADGTDESLDRFAMHVRDQRVLFDVDLLSWRLLHYYSNTLKWLGRT